MLTWGEILDRVSKESNAGGFCVSALQFQANRKQDDPEYTSSLVLTLHWKMILESFRNVVVFSDVFKNFLKRFQAKFYRIFFIAKEF